MPLRVFFNNHMYILRTYFFSLSYISTLQTKKKKKTNLKKKKKLLHLGSDLIFMSHNGSGVLEGHGKRKGQRVENSYNNDTRRTAPPDLAVITPALSASAAAELLPLLLILDPFLLRNLIYRYIFSLFWLSLLEMLLLFPRAQTYTSARILQANFPSLSLDFFYGLLLSFTCKEKCFLIFFIL